MEKSADAFRTISEVADDLTLPQHVLRFWETRFPQIRPMKRAGGRRYYRPADVVLLKTIRQLLYDDGYTIKGVQRLLKEQGPKALVAKAPVDPPDNDRPDPREPPAVESDAPHDVAEEAEDADSAAEHDAIVKAIGTIDECLDILTAARQRS